LGAIAAEALVCRKCQLWETRRNVVSGEGESKSGIVFVGEAPGRSEDVEGRPFAGAAGKFLDSLLSEAGLSRNEVFICNILKCRPPENRQPKPDEIEICTSYLDRQIKTIMPKIIVTLGRHSTAYMFSKASLPFEGITEVHGKSCKATVLGIKVTFFPMFHPAAALYNGEYEKQLIEDFRKLRRELVEQGLVSG
jgi:DNA polymerase